MKKIFLILLLILSANSSLFPDITVEEVYERFAYFFRGTANSYDELCYKKFLEEKDKLIDIGNKAVEMYQNGEKIGVIFQFVVIKIMGLYDLVEECNVYEVPNLIIKVTSKGGLVSIFQNIINDIEKIMIYGGYVKEGFTQKDYNKAALNTGHIFSIAMNFHSN